MLIVIGCFFGALGLVFDHMSLGLFVFAGGVSSAVVGLLACDFRHGLFEQWWMMLIMLLSFPEKALY